MTAKTVYCELCESKTPGSLLRWTTVKEKRYKVCEVCWSETSKELPRITWRPKETMDRIDVDQMEAGYELDTLIGRVIGIEDPVFPYSFDIRYTLRILEKLEYNWTLSRDTGKCGNLETGGEGLYQFVYTAPGAPMMGTFAETAPLAICRGVLKAALDE